MKRFKKTAEPPNFDARCRKRGGTWLASNPVYKRPKDYWSEFEPQLRTAFLDLCGYCAMVTLKSQVDHFVPVAVLKKASKDKDAYEWKNFRYGEGVINQRKSNHIILDPFKVQDNWFEILLPSLQLVLTSSVPITQKKLAEFTIKRLGLRDSEVVVRYRKKFFDLYCDHKLDIDGLEELAPLVAAAVKRDLANNVEWRK
jgi:hypothetical protein